MHSFLYTLCILERDGNFLLGKKKRGFGTGKITSYGGKWDPGESLESSAIREVKEESGLDVRSVSYCGYFDAVYSDSSNVHQVHVFLSSDFYGSEIETEEMIPYWIEKDSLPYDQMFDENKFWFPYVMDKKKFKGLFYFDGKYMVKDFSLKVW